MDLHIKHEELDLDEDQVMSPEVDIEGDGEAAPFVDANIAPRQLDREPRVEGAAMQVVDQVRSPSDPLAEEIIEADGPASPMSEVSVYTVASGSSQKGLIKFNPMVKVQYLDENF